MLLSIFLVWHYFTSIIVQGVVFLLDKYWSTPHWMIDGGSCVVFSLCFTCEVVKWNIMTPVDDIKYLINSVILGEEPVSIAHTHMRGYLHTYIDINNTILSLPLSLLSVCVCYSRLKTLPCLSALPLSLSLSSVSVCVTVGWRLYPVYRHFGCIRGVCSLVLFPRRAQGFTANQRWLAVPPLQENRL